MNSYAYKNSEVWGSWRIGHVVTLFGTNPTCRMVGLQSDYQFRHRIHHCTDHLILHEPTVDIWYARDGPIGVYKVCDRLRKRTDHEYGDRVRYG